MSQQYPQHPGYGAPAPQPPKKRSVGKIAGLGCGGILVLFVIIGIATAGNSGSDSADTSNKDKALTTTDTGAAKDAKKENTKKAPVKEDKTQAEEFQTCVAKSGTPTEKAAVKHVTKVTGADKRNNILDAPEVYTDYTGGFMSSNAGDAKLIASAFTSCYESDNGLVSIYGKDGDLIANANY
ncbi:hypothetical protein [Streptomyces sp. NBC_01236]|uniref:hypothetical protein n=1 Tax=Streptomyces sp. NBC_01236 TaxID=2903789 RepID=UPI002E1490CF|nr:hypothetical protein OG324_50275 [Streptomyces sp. NBC_01236]